MADPVDIKYGPMPLDSLDSEKYGSGEFDVLNEYDWTLAPAKIGRKNVAPLILTQYEMNANTVLANLKYWVRPIFRETASPYEGLYRAQKTGINFILPWFEEYHHSIVQNWEDYKGLESTKIGERVIKGVELLTNSPGIAINTPKVWKGAARASIPYTITLFNATKNPQESINKNRKLIQRLIASTLHDQQNPILASPPALYTMEIKDVRYSPACVLSNLDIVNVGTMIKDPSGGVLPEAYRVKFTINELISESRQIYEGAIGGPLISAIIDDAAGEALDADVAEAQAELAAGE